MHGTGLISTLAVALGLALPLGFLATRLRMPPLVGYLVAGICIGPATPGFVADMDLASQLAEIGIMLMMFGVGLHFSLEDLLAVRRIAVPGALVQIAAATALGTAVALHWGWDAGAALVLGLSLSVASTVVLLRALEDGGMLASIDGRIAVGWLVVEDLAMVLVLVVLPIAAGLPGGGASAGALAAALAATVGKVAAFVILMLVLGRRLLPRLLWLVARSGSRELFTLCVVATALGVAFGSARLFDLSFALGAFFAGMTMRSSEFSHRAAAESLPLRDAFSVLFFVSVGMLFDPGVLLREPFKLLDTLGIVLLAKTAAAVLLVLAFRYPLRTALTVGASLAQIGEFSFILAALGVAEGLLPAAGQSLVLATALASIALNPLLFALLAPLRRRLATPPQPARPRRADPLAALPDSTDPRALSGHAVIVGHGRVGAWIVRMLGERGIACVVVEQNREKVERLRAAGTPAVAGNAVHPEVLVQAHVARAAALVVATPETLGARRMVATARALNPGIAVALRCHSEDEAALLEREGLGTVFLGERELAAAMARLVAEHCPPGSGGQGGSV